LKWKTIGKLLSTDRWRKEPNNDKGGEEVRSTLIPDLKLPRKDETASDAITVVFVAQLVKIVLRLWYLSEEKI